MKKTRGKYREYGSAGIGALVAVLTYLATLLIRFCLSWRLHPFLLTMVLRRREQCGMIMKWKKVSTTGKGVCGANFLPRKYGGASDFGCLQHSGSFKPGRRNVEIVRLLEKGRNAGIAQFFWRIILARRSHLPQEIFMRCGNSGHREGLPVFGIFRAGIVDCKPECKLVRLGTEYARFTENLLYVGDFLNFCRRKTGTKGPKRRRSIAVC